MFTGTATGYGCAILVTVGFGFNVFDVVVALALGVVGEDANDRQDVVVSLHDCLTLFVRSIVCPIDQCLGQSVCRLVVMVDLFVGTSDCYSVWLRLGSFVFDCSDRVLLPRCLRYMFPRTVFRPSNSAGWV